MPVKNTVRCPGCEKTLRVGVRVISDGNEYWFYLCPHCEDVAFQSSSDGVWRLRGEQCEQVPPLVESLRELAADVWRERSTSREPLARTVGPAPGGA